MSFGDEGSVDLQVKSKKRVADHGEVFTAQREVNAMLDLVKHETERIDSRFLEPACGDGNFLAEVLRRKLAIVKGRYGKNPDDYERYSVIAVTSIYGVELLKDNTIECRKRLFELWNSEYTNVTGAYSNDECRKAVNFILDKNILNGDALSLKQVNGDPIVFAEWTSLNGVLLKRRDFRLDEMLEGHKEQITIFMSEWEYDDEVKAMIPKAIKEFPPVHYKKVNQYE
jgi:hypothetical protein